MNSYSKLTAISLIVLGIAGSTYAAAPTPVPASTPTSNSWFPEVSGAFIGIEGLYLRPMNGDLDYVTLFPASAGDPFDTNAIKTTYEWSWRVFAGLKFTENDDITLSWLQMRTSDDNSISLNSTDISAPRWFSAGSWQHVKGRVTFNLDDAYAVWGHTLSFNNPWSIRFAGGIEYLNLKSRMSVLESLLSIGDNTIGYEATSKTNGIGPRVEVDMTYHLPHGFALFANVNTALLFSHRDYSLEPQDTRGASELSSFDFSNRSVTIPKVGLRLGASYSYTWGQAGGEGACRTNVLTVDAGWQAESYIHAIERPIDADASDTKVSNFGDHGLFVGIKFSSDWV